jgi:anaerobic C4-dicarboxylate transporter
LFLATFSIGVAIGSVAVNRLLKGQASAKFSPASALAMGLFVVDLFRRVRSWPASSGGLHDMHAFLALPNSWMVVLDLLGVAVAGGMFVVPLYAFLTTTVPKSETGRTIAANNIVNSGLMVLGYVVLTLAVQLGVTVSDSLLIVAAGSIIAAWLGWKLHLACD